MKHWLIAAIIGLVGATFALDADAQRRLGGARNLGKQSQQIQRQQQPPAREPQAAPGQQASPSAATAPRPSPLRGALLGLAAGLGLAALASWLGLSETLLAILTAVLLAVVVMTVIGFVLRRLQGPPGGHPNQPAWGAAGAGPASARTAQVEPPYQRPLTPSGAVRPGSVMDEFLGGGAARPPADGTIRPWGVPAGFDQQAFLQQAKTHYARMQDAWDRSDFDALADFTTHEMFTALTHELRSRVAQSPGPQTTRVESLDATLLGVETVGNEYVASVRFTGTLDINGTKESVDEVWNLTKPTDGSSGWLLAGIQQMS